MLSVITSISITHECQAIQIFLAESNSPDRNSRPKSRSLPLHRMIPPSWETLSFWNERQCAIDSWPIRHGTVWLPMLTMPRASPNGVFYGWLVPHRHLYPVHRYSKRLPHNGCDLSWYSFHCHGCVGRDLWLFALANCCVTEKRIQFV